MSLDVRRVRVLRAIGVLVTVLGCLLLFTFGFPESAEAQTTALFFHSQPGDYIGQGETRSYTTEDAAFSATWSEYTGARIQVQGPSLSFWWTLHLRGPDEDFLPAVGTYETARRWPFTSFNGLDFDGSGRGCNLLTGRFVVLEAEYGPNGSITRFAADFEQHCSDAVPGLFGAIRFNSTIANLAPFDGLYPLYRLTLAMPTHGRVTADGIACGGESVACQATYLAGANVAVRATPDPGYFFAGWSGDCFGGESTSSRINSPKWCSAQFLPLAFEGQRTLAVFNSSLDEYPPGHFFTNANSRWTISLNPFNNRKVSVRIEAPNFVYPTDDTYWQVTLTPPAGQTFQVGVEYTVPAVSDPNQADLFLSSDSRSCGGAAAFRITEWEQAGDAPPSRLAFDFSIECLSGPPVVGVVQYASTIQYGGLEVDRTDLQFRVTTDSRGIVSRSADQAVAIVQVGPPVAAWRLHFYQPWLTGLPNSGTGSAVAAIRVNPGVYPSSGTRLTGRVTVVARGSVTVPVVTVTLDAVPRDPTPDVAVFRPGSREWHVKGREPQEFGWPGDIPVPGDYDGDTIRDVAVYRPSTGQWLFGDNDVQWGLPGDLPVPGDYNGDGRTDPAVFRTLHGAEACWWIRGETGCRTLGVRGDVPVPADYDSDGVTDIAVYRPSSGTWFIVRSSTGDVSATAFGIIGDVPVPADFDADRKADLAVFRPATGGWYVLSSVMERMMSRELGSRGDVPIPMDVDNDGQADFRVWRPGTGVWLTSDKFWTVTSEQFGQPGDIPVLAALHARAAVRADFDGDGRADVTVFRPSTGEWFTRESFLDSTTFAVRQWGAPGDVLVPGDYDGDRKTDYAVYRPSTGEWFVLRSSTNTLLYLVHGSSIDTPVAADYDGDGRMDMAVYRPSVGEWQLALSSTEYAGVTVRYWGVPGDIPIAADFDGDRRADLAVYRPSSGVWYVRCSSQAYGPWIVKQWGWPDDQPIARDFDGDGRADLGIYRPSTGAWFGVDALSDYTPVNGQWGLTGDEPIALDYDGDGRADAAVYRPSSGHWFVRRSSDGLYYYLQWGLPGDRPVGGGNPPPMD